MERFMTCLMVVFCLLITLNISGQEIVTRDTSIANDNREMLQSDKDKSKIVPYTHPERTKQPQPRAAPQGNPKEKPAPGANTPTMEVIPTDKGPKHGGCGYIEEQDTNCSDAAKC